MRQSKWIHAYYWCLAFRNPILNRKRFEIWKYTHTHTHTAPHPPIYRHTSNKYKRDCENMASHGMEMQNPNSQCIRTWKCKAHKSISSYFPSERINLNFKWATPKLSEASESPFNYITQSAIHNTHINFVAITIHT